MKDTLDILAIGAHPDDVELNAGGTICLLARQGYRVGIVDLTRGELGSRGTPQGRMQEAANATLVLGLAMRENLALPDGNITETQENQCKIIRVLRQYQPHVVMVHPLECRHPDHTAAARLTLGACYYSGLRKIETMDDKGKVQPPWRPHHVLHYAEMIPFDPTFVVDVTDTWEQRTHAMQQFRSQFYTPGYTPKEDEKHTFVSNQDFFQWIEARARMYGYPIGTQYGEPFLYRGSLGVRNMMTLLRDNKLYR